MKQAYTAKRNFRTAAFAVALLALAAAGTVLASPQYVSLTVQGPVDTRIGTRVSDETEPILLSARLPGAERAELVIDGIAYGVVEEIAPDGQIFDYTYEWAFPEYGEEDSDVVHVLTLEKDGAPIYTTCFGGPICDRYSANGIWMGWLINWKDFVAEHFLGNYEKASQGFTVAGVPMYDAYVAAMDPTDRHARIRLILDRLPELATRVRFSVAGSHPTAAIGPRRYVLEATDSLMPDERGTPPVWREVGELPGGTREFSREEARSCGRFLRVRVQLP